VGNSLASLFVDEPTLVPYGCRPWTPERDATYTRQNGDGAWKAPKPNRVKKRKVCGWCKNRPKGPREMCPDCSTMSLSNETSLSFERWLYRNAAAEAAADKAEPKFAPPGSAPKNP
jgi:hypothetical protein